MERIPMYDATAPIACTIGAADLPERLALLERVRTALGTVERTEHGLLLRFPPSSATEADLRRFAVDEKACCAFWGFDVSAAEDDLVLRWEGPPGATELLDRLHAWLRHEGDLPDLAGLL